MSRVLSALVLIAILAATVFLAPAWVTIALASLVAALAGRELAHLAAAAGAGASPQFLAACSAILCVGFVVAVGQDDAAVLAAVLVALVVGTGAVTLAARPEPVKGAVQSESPGSAITRAAVTIMAPMYVGLPLGVMAWIRDESGPYPLLFLLTTIAISDSAQFYVGRAFGRHPLAPRVSPAKTVEGAIGGLVAVAIAGATMAPRWVEGTTAVEGIGLGLALGGFGIIGDLFESLLKRSAGVKDSSRLIPGHGGVLDRIDSYLFAAPVYFLYLRFIA